MWKFEDDYKDKCKQSYNDSMVTIFNNLKLSPDIAVRLDVPVMGDSKRLVPLHDTKCGITITQKQAQVRLTLEEYTNCCGLLIITIFETDTFAWDEQAIVISKKKLPKLINIAEQFVIALAGEYRYNAIISILSEEENTAVMKHLKYFKKMGNAFNNTKTDHILQHYIYILDE